MVGLKTFQTVYKRTLCEHSLLYSPMLSISKLTYFKRKMITAVYVNEGVF